jgi:hypothetical protein
MTAADRHKFLPLALRVVGLIFIFGIYPLRGGIPKRIMRQLPQPVMRIQVATPVV